MLRLIPVLVALYACTTTLPPAPSPTRRAITIISIPPGAVIVVDHDTVGPAPLTAHPNRRRIAGTLDELLIQALPTSDATCRQGHRVDFGMPAADTVVLDMRRCPTIEDPSRIFDVWEVDEQPEPISKSAPHYPDGLRQAGIEGIAVLECVIDTSGRAEPASLRVLLATERRFAKSARKAVLQSTYKPARVRDHP